MDYGDALTLTNRRIEAPKSAAFTLTTGLTEADQQRLEVLWRQREERLDAALRDTMPGVCHNTSFAALAYGMTDDGIQGRPNFAVYSRKQALGDETEVGIQIRSRCVDEPARYVAFCALRTSKPAVPNGTVYQYAPKEGIQIDQARFLCWMVTRKKQWAELRGVSLSADATELDLPAIPALLG